jgi:hypothetical protein
MKNSRTFFVRHSQRSQVISSFVVNSMGLPEKDSMGLPEKIMVCPAYGLDGFASYKKDSDYVAPGW